MKLVNNQPRNNKNNYFSSFFDTKWSNNAYRFHFIADTCFIKNPVSYLCWHNPFTNLLASYAQNCMPAYLMQAYNAHYTVCIEKES